MIQLLQGDARDVLQRLPAGSVHTVITSPPYWNLRDYGAPGQLGMESTYPEYIDRLVGIFEEVRRVLRNDGTLWLNLGDSYVDDSKWGGRSTGKNAGRDGAGRVRRSTGLPKKSLVGIPWRVAFALQEAGWILRTEVVWHKTNGMPESVRDRPSRNHEYVFLFSKSARYYYDAEAVKEPVAEDTPNRMRRALGTAKYIDGAPGARGQRALNRPRARVGKNSRERVNRNAADAGAKEVDESKVGASALAMTRARRSVWSISTSRFSGAHFATFPPALVEPCILAGTSERGVCPVCGAPWKRVTVPLFTAHDGETESLYDPGSNAGRLALLRQAARARGSEYTGQRTTVGWLRSCDHREADPVPAVVLDPFNGAGTSGLVARQLGRHYIGIDISEKYIEMARARIMAAQPRLPLLT